MKLNLQKIFRDYSTIPDVLVSIIIDYCPKYPGRHKFRVNATEFDVDRKYFPIKVLGEGVCETVCLVEDKDTESRFAIKKYSKIFHDLEDAKGILLEAKILAHLDHPNLCHLHDLIPPRSLAYIEDVYLVMDSMEANLHKIIYSRQKLSNEHIQYFIYQILKGLKYLHSAGVVHSDLKPSNILVNRNCDIRICSFALVRRINETMNDREHFFSPHYRSPELLTHTQNGRYDETFDMWSVGCIFAELLGRKVFFPGYDYLEQLRLIIEKIGNPSQEDLHQNFSPLARSYIEGLGRHQKSDFQKLFPDATPTACDLLDKMLQFNPIKRITVDNALKHEYFKTLYNKSRIIECKNSFKFDWLEELTETRLQQLIWDEIYKVRPDLREEREEKQKNGLIVI